jgi:hypothetical protein
MSGRKEECPHLHTACICDEAGEGREMHSTLFTVMARNTYLAFALFVVFIADQRHTSPRSRPLREQHLAEYFW